MRLVQEPLVPGVTAYFRFSVGRRVREILKHHSIAIVERRATAAVSNSARMDGEVQAHQ